jgi:hypothetical protein
MFARILTVSKFVRVAMWRNIPGDTTCTPVEMFDNEQLTVVTRGNYLLGASVLLEGSDDGKTYFPIRDASGNPIFRDRIGVQEARDKPRYVRPCVIGECRGTPIDVHLIMRSGAFD